MCTSFHFPIPPPWTHRSVSRTEIQHKRIYAFAANRFSDATSPEACKFWRGVMDRCVQTNIEYIPLSRAEQQTIWERRQ